MADKNTAGLWDAYWKTATNLHEDLYLIAKVEKSILWKRIMTQITLNFPGVQGLKVIELGAGSGTYSAILSRMGADVTILDYSEQALAIARKLFESLGLKGKFILADALNLPQDLLGKFDVCMSYGLTEHFLDDSRVGINKSHMDLIRSGGLAVVSVPNAWCIPYRIAKWLSEKLGKWKVGEEYPYSRKELISLFKSFGIKSYTMGGNSLVETILFWANPFRLFFRTDLSGPADIRKIRQETGTPLDQWLSYAIVINAVKK